MKTFFRYIFNKDIFLVLLFTAIVSLILTSLNLKLDAFNPIEKMFADFDMTDIYFSKIKNQKTRTTQGTQVETASADDRIVVVNIGGIEGGRQRVADLLTIINTYQPKCVGLDAFYKSYKTDSTMLAINENLEKQFLATKNLVVAMEAYFREQTRAKIKNDENFAPNFDSLIVSNPKFTSKATVGIVNLITEGTRDNFSRSELSGGLATCRTFSPRDTINNKEYLAFPVEIVKIYAPEKAKRFLARNNTTEIIDYSGNYQKFGYLNYATLFEMADAAAADDEGAKEALKNSFKDKIVLLGFTGINDINVITSDEDRFFTPLNDNYVGRAEKDMYGVHIHANIISMILNEEYIDEASSWLDYLVVFIIAYFTTALFIFLYKKLDFWYDGLSILVQFLLSLLVVIGILEVFGLYKLKVNWSLAFLAIVFIPNFIEVYYGAVAKVYEYRQNARRRKGKQTATLGVGE